MGATAEQLFSTPYILGSMIPQVWNRFLDITLAMFREPQMMWIITPLITAILLMEFYFGRYRREELGWNTAVGNSMVLIFVSIDLLRQLYSEALVSGTLSSAFFAAETRTFIAFFIGLEGAVILAFNFFHALPKKVAFSISSALPVNFTAYLAIVLIYAEVPIDWLTFWAALLLLLILKAVFMVVHLLEPEYMQRYHGNLLYKLLMPIVRSEEEMHREKRRKRKQPRAVIPFLKDKHAEDGQPPKKRA